MPDISNDSWRISGARNGGRELRWIPLIRIKSSEPWIGTTELCHWVVEGNGDVIPIDHAHMLPLLHCLEAPIEEFMAALSKAIDQFSIGGVQVQEFPYYGLIDFALRSKSDYWADLALQWLETLPLARTRNDALHAIVKSRWATQKTRYHAQRILARVAREARD
jgi:hypothetical protein